MTRKELISKVATLLREADVRKTVLCPRQSFYISDEQGKSKRFSTSGAEKKVLYTVEDVGYIIDACMDVIEDSMRQGDLLTIRNFGSFELAYRKEKYVLDINRGSGTIKVPARYVPKFIAGNRLKEAAQVYTSLQNDKEAIKSFPTEKELMNIQDEPLDVYEDFSGEEE